MPNITYKPNIHLLNVKTVGNTANVITCVTFTYIATTDDGRSERLPLILEFTESPDANNFIPLADITAEIVTGWIENDWTERANVEARMATFFDSSDISLPWVDVHETTFVPRPPVVLPDPGGAEVESANTTVPEKPVIAGNADPLPTTTIT